jgi:hypothetical protein
LSIPASCYPLDCDPPRYEEFSISVDAHSGPSGENPSGTADFGFDLPQVITFVNHIDVTCLRVEGNVAVIGGTGYQQADHYSPEIAALVRVVDAGGPNSGKDTFDWEITEFGGPPDCSAFPDRPPTFMNNMEGDLHVVDALPLPTSKDQCKNAGWRTFGDTFKNQGQCVAFVERGPKP